MNWKAIVLNTLKEAIRNKIFYLLFFFGLFFVFSSRIIGLLTIGDQTKVIKDVGLASINFFCVLIAIFTGINLVHKEIDKKTIYTILSKPISRDQFILGKFLGLLLTVGIALASMATIFILFLVLTTGKFEASLLLYFLMLFMELAILISISLLFSSFSTPILSSIFTITIYLIGQITWTYNHFKYLLKTPLTRVLTDVVYYLLPNLHKYNVKNEIVLGTPVAIGQLLVAVGYSVLYIGCILFATLMIFRKREFQ